MNSLGTSVVVLSVCAFAASLEARVFVVNNRGANASDENPGTEDRPLKTIQAGANLARAGDTVLVKTGIYREEVIPPRGGSSPAKPIVYRAAPGEVVSIRGSEQISSWVEQDDGTWVAELETSFFKGYNPFAIPVTGEWLQRNKGHRLGDVYCNGEALLQKMTLEELRSTPNTWFTDLRYGYASKTDFPAERQYPGGKIRIHANFGGLKPNKNLTEINARATAIFPEKSGLRHIVLDGFDIRHTAPQWGDIYSLEKGAIGTKYGYGWTIQNCTITNSRNIGISLGVSDEVYFPRKDEGGLLEGGGNIPPMETIGHHLIRNNTIRRCGQTGIYGCYGAVGCVIDGNVISETNYRTEWFGSNQAAIKILFPIDVIIRNNLLLGMPGVRTNAKGIWLDWGSQNTRVTGNVIYDFGSALGLFLEVNFGPIIVDHNVLVRSSVLIESNGSILAHNLFDNCSFFFMASPKRTTPYYKPHSTVRTGKTSVTLTHNRIFNNIFAGTGFNPAKLVRDNADSSGIQVDHNVYLGGAGAFPGKDAGSVVDASDPAASVELGPRAVTVGFELPEAAMKGRHPQVTSKLIGKVPLAEMGMENPDGTPLDLNVDCLGKSIEADKVRPGPFQAIRGGANRFVLRFRN